jgi:plastocyanin
MMKKVETRRLGTTARIGALVLFSFLTVVTHATAQPLTERTPNLAGAWVSSPGTLHFQFAHRFEVAGEDANISDIFGGEGKIVNYPTFDFALGLFEGAMAGVRYSSNSPGAGLINEWQPYVKYAPFRGIGDGLFSLSIQGAWNGANQSLDGELAAETRAGPLLLSGAVRGFSDIYDLPDGVDDEALALAGGIGIKLNPYVTLAADVADLVAGPDGDMAWSAGLNLGIPFTPHTLSIMATNVASGTLAGVSAGSGTFLADGFGASVFWGFEFTVPFSGFARWGRIFKPDELRSPEAVAAAPGRRVVEVEISQVAFRDREIRVPAGTTVRWVNKDPVGHTATADDQTWGSAMIGPGEFWEFTFEQQGEFPYHCIPHPFMKGVVIVED